MKKETEERIGKAKEQLNDERRGRNGDGRGEMIKEE